MPSLHEILYEDSLPIWLRIKQHPFVQELYRGILPIEKYRHYVAQDYYFLVGMTRAFALLAGKAHDYALIRKALWLAYSDATIELENYEPRRNRAQPRTSQEDGAIPDNLCLRKPRDQDVPTWRRARMLGVDPSLFLDLSLVTRTTRRTDQE